MAITTINFGFTYQPVYNVVWYTVTSTNTAQDNFRYICDIYPTGASSPSFYRMKRPADPDTGNATFDVHRILENFVTADKPDKGLNGFQKNSNSYIKYDVKFGEEYGPSSAVVAYPDLNSEVNKYAWNAALDFQEFEPYNQATYILLAASPKDFLTNRPSSGVISTTEDAWLYMISRTSGTIDYMQIETYDSNGASLGIWKVDNPEKAFPTDAGRFLRFDAGPNNLNEIAGVFQQGSAPIIDTTNAKKYYLQAFNASGLAASNPHWFTIDDGCTPHTPVRLHFLNKLGGFDSFTFSRLNKRRSTNEKKTYRKALGTESGGNWGYNIDDRRDTTYNVEASDVFTANSDWVTPAEMDWLEELVESPEVYYDDGTNLIAVNIITATWEQHKRENTPLANLVIEYKYSYERKRQRG